LQASKIGSVSLAKFQVWLSQVFKIRLIFSAKACGFWFLLKSKVRAIISSVLWRRFCFSISESCAKPSNKACSGRRGVCALYKHFSGFEFSLHLKQNPRPPASAANASRWLALSQELIRVLQMTNPDAEQIANQLKQKANLLRIEHSGNTQIWFSNETPANLPIANSFRNISSEKVPLPHNHYQVITNEIKGWLIFWKHLGPKCMAAGTFISISPLNSGKAVVTIELAELQTNSGENSDALWMYGFESENDISYLCKGITDGLLAPYIGHPLADVKIRILNSLTHKVDSSPKAFEVLGNYLMEAMIFELFKRDWIKSP